MKLFTNKMYVLCGTIVDVRCKQKFIVG